MLQRNDTWWDASGGPYLDQVELLSISDNTARVNALQSGQVDLITDLKFQQYAQLASDPRWTIVRVPGASTPTLKMRVDKPPFDDPRVREAFKLIVDRAEMFTKVLAGFGQIGNDAFGQGGPDFKEGMLVRPHDPEQARQLLHQAGKDNLTVTLHTNDTDPGTFESASLFVEQAKAAGVTVNLDKLPVDQFYNPSDRFIDWEFSSMSWNQNLPIAQLMAACYLSDSTFDITGWIKPDFDNKYHQAMTAPDETTRKQLLYDLQQQLHDNGGDIVFGIGDAVLVTSSKVHNVGNLPFYRTGSEGDFSKVYLG